MFLGLEARILKPNEISKLYKKNVIVVINLFLCNNLFIYKKKQGQSIMFNKLI